MSETLSPDQTMQPCFRKALQFKLAAVSASVAFRHALASSFVFLSFIGNMQGGGLLLVISKEAVRNSWGILDAILGHTRHQNHPNSHIKRIKPKFVTKSEFYHILWSFGMRMRHCRRFI